MTTNEKRPRRWQFSLRVLIVLVGVAPPALAAAGVAIVRVVAEMQRPDPDPLMLTVTPRLIIMEEEPLLGLDEITEHSKLP